MSGRSQSVLTRAGRVAVVGGGLAGISAAIQLADRGWQVTVFEARPRLGGATYSFDRGGLAVDTGQHVLLRCYSTHRALLERLEVSHLVPVQQRMEIPVLRPGCPPSWLRRGAYGPAPLHLIPAVLGFAALSPVERLNAVWAAAALSRVDPTDHRHDLETFGNWLVRHGQGERAIARLWGLVCLAALNIEPEQASLALAAKVFRTGLLDSRTGGDIAVPQAPLSELHDRPVRRLLGRLGARLATGNRVTAIEPDGDGLVVRTATGEVEVEGAVLAVPHQQAAQLVPAAACPNRDRWAGLGSSPIVNVHLRYDRPVTALSFAAAVDSPASWIFDRTLATAAEGQYLVVSLSAADHQLRRPAGELVDEQQAALQALFPAAREATLLDGFVTREPHATFRQGAGTQALRPTAHTLLPRLALAGSWTDTGWPDTMEGAVRSGLTAATLLGFPDHPAQRRAHETTKETIKEMTA